MLIRKNAADLSAAERTAFVGAVLELKRNGIYDNYVEQHHHAMSHVTVGENEFSNRFVRNAAHRGPSFLPWHREYLRRFERDLQAINPDVTLPYWDWTADAALQNPVTSSIWDENFMGGTGTEKNDWIVASGPFAYETGNWSLRFENRGPELRRGFGQWVDPFRIPVRSLPTRDDVRLALSEIVYDAFPWDSSPFLHSFRNRLEGWVTPIGDPRVAFPGVQLHNRVHVWIGGTMASPTSPNDPVFFLHHAFVDKLWVEWVRLRRADPVNHEWEPHYLPVSGVAPGHHRDEPMLFLDPEVRPADTLDHHVLGYAYDDEPEVSGAPGFIPEYFQPTDVAETDRIANFS